ncbi:hypothetical protein EJ04DRAFT_514115 [Polyplosphaeria fusca]|uniref:Uncharacterized protein n=1 Tax=Polyplosphaeria fusca TaxID=682080 RepID=A0A9P4UZ55_9PLEO|nr:hypothetical protein EJ04DRAFT_514115 [Polyplosphaeria fusca]
MHPEDPFDSFGLDFSIFGNYNRANKGQQPIYNIEYVDLLGAGSQHSSQSAPSSNRTLPTLDHGQLLFLAGCPGPDQIDRLTKEYEINPEFWRRHLDSVSTASPPTFEDLKLPSAICGIFQLRFWTIGSRVTNITEDQESIDSLRKDAEARMERYRQDQREKNQWQPGDSIVRGFEIHDREYFSIEQVITIYLSEERKGHTGNDGKWFALTCSDCGRFLHESPSGPWMGSHLPGRADFHTKTFPVPEHRLWTSIYNGTPLFNGSVSKTEVPLRALQQSLATLPRTFSAGQDLAAMHEDPMYALHRIFSFFTSNEAHVLSFLSSQIEKHSSTSGEASQFADTEPLSNLLHCQRLLGRHVEELRYVLRIVRSRVAKNEIAKAASRALEQDLVYLIERAVTLRSRSETSISLSMNVASIGEARRGVQQNKSLFRFTIIASVYVPLSFVATLFGMNFRQFGQGDLSIWIYFVVSVPVFVVSALFLFINPHVLRGGFRRIIARR